DGFGMVENIPCHCLAADPAKGPERRRQIDGLQFGFRGLPQRRDLAGQVEAQFRTGRGTVNGGMGANERLAVDHRTLPAMIAARTSQPHNLFDLNLERQSRPSSMSSVRTCHIAWAPAPATSTR